MLVYGHKGKGYDIVDLYEDMGWSLQHTESDNSSSYSQPSYYPRSYSQLMHDNSLSLFS